MISFWPVHLFIVFLATSYNQSFNHGSTSTRTRETPAAFGAILQSPLQDKLSEFLNKGWGGFSRISPPFTPNFLSIRSDIYGNYTEPILTTE